MGIFDRFKRPAPAEVPSTGPVILGAVADGTVVPMQEIPDEVFSTGVLGVCCGIDPTDGTVYAPANGTITQVADTFHAIGLEANGIEILIHVGVDTVEMNGDGFSCKVKEGDKVRKGLPILTMNLAKIKAAGHPAVIITAITNSDEFSAVEPVASGTVSPGADFLNVSR